MDWRCLLTQNIEVPVITIDGGLATGKGTVSKIVAEYFDFHRLESGLLYRAVAFVVLHLIRKKQDDPQHWQKCAQVLDLYVSGDQISIHVSPETRFRMNSSQLYCPEVTLKASQVAADPGVREAVLSYQLAMRKLPGLVAEGRDQAYIFDGGQVDRFFLVVSDEEAARRRLDQYRSKGEEADYVSLLAAVRMRNKADRERSVSPLQRHPRAIQIRTDDLPPGEVAARIIDYCK